MKARILLVTCVLSILGCASTPPNNTISVSVKKTTFSGTSQPVWYFYSVHPDCSSEGLPTVEITSPASHGAVTLQNVEHFTEYPQTNQRYECNNKKSPSVAVVYTSEQTFVGTDKFKVRCIYPSGNTKTEEFLISVEKPQSNAVGSTPPQLDPNHLAHIGQAYYPRESLAIPEEGICNMEVTIERDGSVSASHLVKSSSFSRLDAACQNAFPEDVRFIPATKDGTPIKVTVIVPIVWCLGVGCSERLH
jgi:TonB family protein